MAGVRVERPGALTTVQDAGRPGLAHLGVPRSGALDPAAHHLANRLAGNPETAPVLEATLTGVALRFQDAATIAVTGATAPVSLDGQPISQDAPVLVSPGQLLDVGRPRAGVRSYIAVSGGFALPPVLGSTSTDLLSGLGPPPLAKGQVLPIAEASTPVRPGWGRWSRSRRSACRRPAERAPAPAPTAIELQTHPGPRQDWLTPEGQQTLDEKTFTVALASNRIGIRLEGPLVDQVAHGELPSEGMVWGAVQLLPDGNLIVFLADHPTTGGYPVIMVVDPAGFSACAQAAPGTKIRFRPAR